MKDESESTDACEGAVECIENHTFDEIKPGDSADLRRRLTLEDIKLFAAVTGNANPVHVDEAYAKSDRFHAVIAHGMWGGSLISTVLGTRLPGPGTIYTDLNLHFHRAVRLGDVIDVSVTAREKEPQQHGILFDCVCRNDNGELVIDGQAKVIAPTEKIRRPRVLVPEVRLEERSHLHQLMAQAAGLQPLPTAVVWPISNEALGGAVEAARAALIDPILIGPVVTMKEIARGQQLDLSRYGLVEASNPREAARIAVERVRAGAVHALMKGSLHTDELLHPVLDRIHGLRLDHRRMSHVFAFDVPTYSRPVFITDAAINISPDLAAKRDIVQNAIDLLHALAIDEPKVAILSAVETINPGIPSTLDAAALCKMADRGQITGAIVDGPLAFDNAVSKRAARTKGIQSRVAGRAEIFVVPDLESGNMLAKQLEYLADAKGAGLVVGARVPIILTSRADDATNRSASCALAVLMAHHQGRVESL